MASKDYNCGSTVGWVGSAPTNLKSIAIGRTGGGWGSQGSPGPEYGAGKPMPVMGIPKGAAGNK